MEPPPENASQQPLILSSQQPSQNPPQNPPPNHAPQAQQAQQPPGPGQILDLPKPTPPANFPPLPPPPELPYRTETEAVQAIKAFAHDHHYAVVTKRTNKGREGKLEAIYMTCDQGQVYRSTAKERQRTPSRRNGCPFNIRISYQIAQKTQYIKALLDINLPPSQILKQLRHVDPTTVIQLRDIYNLRHRLYQGNLPVPAITIGDFKPAMIQKRRSTTSPGDQPSGDTSMFDGIESGPGSEHVTEGAVTQGSASQDALFDATLF
ncbi:hypothetical protein BJX61DRAFT_448497 [Aspergillus egyptiacus]|nr:hypothetical protein BJX61DRAFT_448497 [Aspergillus egyptiacus]